MQSKTSWFNKEIILQGFRSSGWLGIIYFGALFFLLPIKMLMLSTSEMPEYHLFNTNNLSRFNEVPDVFVIVIPVLVAIFIQRYLQVKQSSDLYHSLPVRRSTLYHHLVTVGAILLVVPVVLIGIIVTILHPVLGLDVYFNLESVLTWTAVTILFNLLIYTSCIFIGMLTGNSIVQGVLTYIFLFFPVAVSVLVSFNLDIFLYGYKADYLLNDGFERLSPLSRVVLLGNKPFTLIETVIYLVIAIILYIAALLVYNKRKIEMVSNPIAFQFLKPIFKYGVTFFSMLSGGFYFTQMEGQGQIGWTIFGYVAGAILGYLIAEMILQKSWRINLKVKGFVYFALATVVVSLLLHFDVTGYERKVPELADIERIYYSNTDYYYFFEEEGPTQYFYEKENMENIVAWHEKLIEKRTTPLNRNEYYERAFFAYELKSGKTIIREYEIPYDERNVAFMKPIYESLEYKKVNYRALSLKADDVKLISFHSRGHMFREVTITDWDEISELLDALKEDIKNETYEDQVNRQGVISEMFFHLEQNNKEMKHEHAYITETGHSIKASYSTIEKWLKEKGIYEDAVLTGNDLEYAIVAKLDSEELKQEEFYSYSHKDLEKKLMSRDDAIKVTDKDKITELLNSSNDQIYDSRSSEKYIIAFKHNKEDYLDIRAIEEKYLDNSLKN